MKVIGSLHVCQKGPWRRSWALLEEALIRGLAQASDEIQITILAHNFDLNVTFLDKLRSVQPNLKIKSYEDVSLYERPTLLNMRQVALQEPDAVFWQAHTKGIRWWDTPKDFLIDIWVRWLIQTMLVDQSHVLKAFEDTSVDCVGTNQTDHCQYGFHPHFSGNFWWARSSWLAKCPPKIGRDYIDPEFWLLKNRQEKPIVIALANSNMDHHTGQFQRIPDASFRLFVANVPITEYACHRIEVSDTVASNAIRHD